MRPHSLPETTRTHVNTHKLGPHSLARLAIFAGILFGPQIIFDGHNFNLKGPIRTQYGSGPLMVRTELAMSWPAVPCLACFSHFPPNTTEHRLQVGQFCPSAGKWWMKFCPLLRDGGHFCPHWHAVELRQATCMLLNVIAR